MRSRVSNILKKVIQIHVLLTLYELNEFCLLVIYSKPGVVQFIYIAGHRLLLKKVAFLSLNIIFVNINSEDPDEMPYDAALYLGLHCLPKYTFRSQWYTQGEINSLLSALKSKIYDQHLLSLRAVGSFYFVH